MPHDAFLDAHFLRPGYFDISVGVQPASIRDQITRGALMAARAFDTGLINTTDANLLVVGAGVAGATCAMTAAALGVRTTLIDKDVAFSRQRECDAKVIEPTFYDWPAPHWDKDAYPWHGETLGLNMVPTHGINLSASWLDRLADAQTSGALQYFEHTTLDGVPTLAAHRLCACATQKHKDVTISHAIDHLGIVVFATGPGMERDLDTPPDHRSYGFWETDPLSSDELQCSTLIISGGGDGALQDFLRAIFVPFIRPAIIVQELNLDDAQHELYSMQQHAAAAYVWWGSPRTRHDSERFVEEIVERTAQRLWEERREHITRVFDRYRRESIPRIMLVHPCDHFARSFLINRLLVALVLRWVVHGGVTAVERVAGQKIVIPVHCTHPPSDRRTGDACYTHPHEVRWYPASCMVVSREDESAGAAAELVLIRHGVVPRPAFAELYEGDPRRVLQILPSHLAHESLLRV